MTAAPGEDDLYEFALAKSPYSRVTVAGSFNAWNKDSHPMFRQPDGSWKLTIQLPRGPRHLYKFVGDGQTWFPDPANPLREADGLGGWHSVLPAPTQTLVFYSGRHTVTHIVTTMETVCQQHDLPTPVRNELMIALGELVTNIFVHAYRNQPNQPLEISLDFSPDKITGTLIDSGSSFDHQNYVPRNYDQPRPGGMGVTIYRALLDSVIHRQTPDGRNITVIVKQIK